MSYSRNKLTVKSIKSLPPGTHGDGGGLWLRKSESGNGQWIYRFRLHDRQRQMGLGSLAKVSLARARELRDEAQTIVVQGRDPVHEKRKARQAARAELVTLSAVSEDAFKARQAELKGDGKAGRWFSPLQLHVLPKLGAYPIVQVGQRDIRDALAPIWNEKADTARKALNRLNIIYQHAAALGLDVDIQVVAKAKALLGKQRHRASHIPAMPWTEVPNFFASLSEDSPVHLALKLLILNPGPRSMPVRFLHLDHVAGDVWTVPGELMKGARGKVTDWKTPLTKESLQIIEKAKRFEQNGCLFPNVSGKGVISDASMSRLMERRGLDYRPHGFRSSFKTWAAETGKQRDIAEICLAHKIHGSVEAAYLRTDFLEERRELMAEWSRHVSSNS
jgi:integrase